MTETKRETKTRKRIREETEASIFDYLKGLAAEQPIRITVKRVAPKTYMGVPTEGTLDDFDEPVTENDIRQLYGGGKYQLTIKTPDDKGSWTYFTSRTIKIAGHPKVDGLDGANVPRVEEPPSVVNNALKMSADLAKRMEDRADRAEAKRGSDGDVLRLVMDDLRDARQESRISNERFLELARRPDESGLTVLLEKALEGESARMQSLQLRLDAELRTKNDVHAAAINDMRSRHDSALRDQREAHQREIDQLNRSFDNQMSVTRQSYDARVEGLSREIAHLERQLKASQDELATLRSKKDKNLADSLTELATLKEALDTFSGGKEDGSVIERVIASVMGSPLAEGVAARIGGAEPPPENTARPDQVGPVRLSDGRILMRRADGSVVEIKPRAEAAQPGDPQAGLTSGDLSKVLPFMESSLQNGTGAEDFARTALTLAPDQVTGPVRGLLKTRGVAAFLELVSEVKPESLLLSQRGKNWVRKVAEILLR